MGRLTELDRRLAHAPEEVRQQAELLTDQIAELLDQAEDDDVWAGLIGPAYTTDQVSKLLRVSRQAVEQRDGLLRLEQRDGTIVYPVFQFDGSTVLPGIQQVVVMLTPAAADSWTIASWLLSPNPELAERRPCDELRRGEILTVVQAAQQFADGLTR
jgi:hypothetical protein